MKVYDFEIGQMNITCDCGEKHTVDLTRQGEIKTKIEERLIKAAVDFVEHYKPHSGSRDQLHLSDDVESTLYKVVSEYLKAKGGE